MVKRVDISMTSIGRPSGYLVRLELRDGESEGGDHLAFYT